MAVIRNFTEKAAKTRERVRRHRRLKKIKEKYENDVYFELQKRNQFDIEENCDHPNENTSNCENTSNHESDENFNFQKNLKRWAVKHRVTQMAINDLLSILIAAGFAYLPKDSRTFMCTPSNVEISELSKGQMWYRGISNNLNHIFKKLNDDISIYLDFNFDGVPLYNSSTKCFWPIIVSIRGMLKLAIQHNE